MYRFLKTQNFSYSMIRTCLKDHSLVGLLDKSRSSQFIFWMQMRSVRPYSRGKKRHQQSSLVDIEEKTDKQNLYEDMMQLLNVGAKAEEEQLARLREKKSELKEMVQLEVETTGIPAIIRAMVPSLFLNKHHSFSGVLFYPTPVDWYCEVEHPYQTSEAYDRLCLKLEVPYYLVSGFSGRQALFKLCEVTKPGNSIFSFCEDSQAIDELFEVFAQRVNNLEKKDLMKLIHYSYILKDFSVKCYKKIFSRFMVSMDNQKYSISELLDFLDVLKQVDQSIFVNGQISRFERLTGSIWNYISNRPQSISCSLLRRLYCNAPKNHERIFSVLDKVLIDNLDRLEVCDVCYLDIHRKN
ncbi:uncharacterized protein LOC128546357 [Mercenaria mercenaria]|uniref:uncharacterized protein LOC128546357 n=1 Tax=Mercenaria mercenaria TaxID=6596 RepID=UPI00234F7C1D|nr:uncharacterized protein LOC128546357 [Mercenaria mercenaria]